MSGVPLSHDTECRSLGFVNNPPRGYFRTVKTCIPKAKNLNIEGNVCVGGMLQTDLIVPKTLNASPPTVRVEGDLCVDGALKTTGDICFEGTVQTDVIAPKTLDTSPMTPVTIDGDLCVNGTVVAKSELCVDGIIKTESDVCVEGTVQTDFIEPKTTDSSPETPVTVQADLCVEGTVQTDFIAPKTTNSSPETPVTVQADLCVEGTVQTDFIAPKTTDSSPPTPVTVQADLCVDGSVQVDCLVPKSGSIIKFNGSTNRVQFDARLAASGIRGDNPTPSYVALIFDGQRETITAGTGGAISILTYSTNVNVDAGGDAYTLADGSMRGQLKHIRLESTAGGSPPGAAVITPANLETGTTITLTGVNAEVELLWRGAGTSWRVVKTHNATLV